MSGDHDKYFNLKSSDDSTMNVPKICLLPQTTIDERGIQLSLPGSVLPTVYKSSNRDSGNFDSLFTGSKVSINNQIKTVHNWFKHLPGCDQTRLFAILLPSVHFDYMAMISSLAQRQAKYIVDEVLDYQNLEEESNNIQSLVTLDEEPSSLAVNLLSRLPLLQQCDIVADTNPSTKTASLAVHKLYGKLLTQLFVHEFSDVEEMLTVRQLATITAHHPNLLPQIQNKLTELAIERLLLDERGDLKRSRRPGALSPFGPPSQMTQTQSFSLLVPPFQAASCLSASASPQSVCSYNSSGFHSGAESANRRHHPPLSPQSSESSCTGDENSLMPHSASLFDYDTVSLQPPNDGNDSSNGEEHPGSIDQGQSSMDTPTPSSASSVMFVTRQLSSSSTNSPPLESLKSPVSLLANIDDYNCSLFRDDEVDSETNYPLTRDTTVSGRNTFTEPGSGMSNVPSWLKTLRLHKYASLFQQLDYQEMLIINDEWLESKNVTKGARNKILVNIHKLESRQSMLRQIESELISSGSRASLRACLNEIRYVLSTPIRPFSDEASGYVMTATSGIDSPPHSVNGNVAQGDLPGQVVRCLSRVCSQMLVSKKVDEENYSLFVHIIDLIMEHESFTGRHKSLCMSWYSQFQGHRSIPRKGSGTWSESQKSSCSTYRKSSRQPSSSCQTTTSSYIHTSGNLYSSTEPSSVPSYPRLPLFQYRDMPPQLPLPTLGALPQPHPAIFDIQSQSVMKRQVERTLSAPNQTALMDLFLQCQSFPISANEMPPLLVPLSTGVPISRMVPSWPLNQDIPSIDSSIRLPQTGNDSSPNGSQDPATAEINRNLDLLAREVTELAIRDPESPET